MYVHQRIEKALKKAISETQSRGLLPGVDIPGPIIERPQRRGHGDYSCSLALKLARPMRKNPMEIAKTIAAEIAPDEAVDRVDVARPGFINFTLSSVWLAQQVEAILDAGSSFGNASVGAGLKVQVEFVSVNPNGPIHVGHARGAVFGSALANVLEAAGYEVEREYYVNDGGNQMDLFDRSLYARYLQALGRDTELPEGGYQGAYLVDFAREIVEEEGSRFSSMPEDVAIAELGAVGLRKMVALIRDDLRELRVEYDVWFNERSLYANGQFAKVSKMLEESGSLAERDGAVWFMSTLLGYEEDKVFIRSNKEPTYFASDVAYHYNKLVTRGFDRVINIWGADHQGNVPFMKAMMTALGLDQDRLDLLLYQLVTLRRGGETVRLATRAGDLVTLKELVDEVGPDACRFFFLTRSPDSQMEFDLDLATQQSRENPVYYIQYAHARICGIQKLAEERGIGHGDGDVLLLTHEAELDLLRKMLQLPDLMETMAANLSPHYLTSYSLDLATLYHRFNDTCRVVSRDRRTCPCRRPASSWSPPPARCWLAAWISCSWMLPSACSGLPPVRYMRSAFPETAQTP